MRIALPLAAALLLGACNMGGSDGGNHQNIRRDFPVGAFQKVVLAGHNDVVVTVGGNPSVRAEGDKAAIDRLDIKVENGELTIGTKPHSGWSWNFGGSHHNRGRLHPKVTTSCGCAGPGPSLEPKLCPAAGVAPSDASRTIRPSSP